MGETSTGRKKGGEGGLLGASSYAALSLQECMFSKKAVGETACGDVQNLNGDRYKICTHDR